jgi:glyceraldehyde 3-phosphate dehydrogenase
MCVVCDVMPIDQVAYLMAHDSTYGKPAFSLDCDDSDLIVGGKNVRYLQIDRRRGLPDEDVCKALREFELDVFIDATGTATIVDLRAIIEQKIAKKVICTLNMGLQYQPGFRRKRSRIRPRSAPCHHGEYLYRKCHGPGGLYS